MPSGKFKNLTGYFVYTLLVATIGPLLFGYHLAELNAPQDVITCKKKAISASTLVHTGSYFREESVAAGLPQCIPMDSAKFGLVSSFFTLGGLLGALSAGPTSAKFGRLRTMLYTTSFFVAGSAIEALAPNIAVLIIGRTIAGLGAGAAVVVVPIFISETAPPGEKGFFGSFTQIMINFGILIAQVLGYFLSKGQLWRIILGVGGVIGVLQAAGLILGGQESPKWLAEHGKGSTAKKALRRLRGHDANIEEEVAGWGSNQDNEGVADEEESLLRNEDRPDAIAKHNDQHDQESFSESASCAARNATNTNKEASKEALGVIAVLRDPNSRPAIVAVMMVMIAQQLCGINSIVMFGVSLLADLLAANSALLNILVAVLNIIVTTAAAPLVDKIGRKPCLLISIAGMGINSVLLAIGIMKHIPALSAIAVLLFVSSFGIGLGPVPFILSSELVGPEAVGATQSWSLAANWVATFVVAQFFPIISEKLGKGETYFIFAGFAVFFGGFIAWWVPETMGKANADEVWGRGKVADRED